MRDVVVSPLGFLSDHMEVMYDLDHEAAALCRGTRHQLRARGHRRHTPRDHRDASDLIAATPERGSPPLRPRLLPRSSAARWDRPPGLSIRPKLGRAERSDRYLPTAYPTSPETSGTARTAGDYRARTVRTKAPSESFPHCAFPRAVAPFSSRNSNFTIIVLSVFLISVIRPGAGFPSASSRY